MKRVSLHPTMRTSRKRYPERFFAPSQDTVASWIKSLPAACLLLWVLLGSARAEATVTVTLDGSDTTQKAAPIERGHTILVNVAALAASLGMRAQITAGESLLTDAKGTDWKARNGSPFLEAGTRRLTLPVVVLQQGSALYLPIETVAELAGAHLDFDSTKQVAHLSLQREAEGARVGDWQNFTLEKPSEEPETPGSGVGSERLATPAIMRMPSTHDHLLFGLGFGYLQGSGLGTQLTAEGRYLGANIRFASVLTTGQRGLSLQNTQFWWEDQEAGKTVELGNFYSDLWGNGFGGRYAWHTSKDHQTAVSLYLNSPNSSATHPVLALRDSLRVGRNVWLGGEIATDGSQYVQGRVQTTRWSGLTYYRHLTTGSGSGYGGIVSYDIGHGFGLYAEISHSAGQNDRNDWRNIGIRLPITRLIDLTLEQTYSRSNANTNHNYAAMLSLPLGPLRLYTRYQSGYSAALGLGPGSTLGGQNVQMQTTLSYLANPRLRLELQSYASGLRSGLHSEREEFTTHYRLSNRTQFQITTQFPQSLVPQGVRLHLEHQVSNSLALTAEYGLPSFTQSEHTGSDWQGLTFMLRTHWATLTPTRGGQVKGQVTDLAGNAIRSVLVRLNDYQTQTDANGSYAFKNVPAGTYELNILESSLPADCKVAQPSLLLTVDTRSRKKIPLKVMPLHTITGHVVCDTEENEKTDTGKPMNGIAVSIDGFVTATDKEGFFAFYNLEPGPHKIRLLTERLPEDLILTSPAEIVTELPSDHSVSGLVFRLKKHEKDTVFQDAK